MNETDRQNGYLRLLEEAFKLLGEVEQTLLCTSNPMEQTRLNKDIGQIKNDITELETRMNDQTNKPMPPDDYPFPGGMSFDQFEQLRKLIENIKSAKKFRLKHPWRWTIGIALIVGLAMLTFFFLTPTPLDISELQPLLDTAVRQKDWDNAIRYGEAILKKDSHRQPALEQTINAYFERGNNFHSAKNYDKAISDYTSVVKLNPNNAAYYDVRGSVYYNQKKYDLALADYNQALKLNPENADYYNVRANIYYDQKQYELAIADYTQALKLKPSLASAYYNRGLIYELKGDKPAAKSDFQKAADLGLEAAKAKLEKLNSTP